MVILASWLESDSIPPAEPGASLVTPVLADPAAPTQPMPAPAPESALSVPSPGLMVSTPQGRQRQQQAGGQHLEVSTYRCPAVHCRACPQQATCAKNPQAGLTMQRSEHEDVVEALQARMATAEAKALYKLRKQPWS